MKSDHINWFANINCNQIKRVMKLTTIKLNGG
jgi:hypothetical protein